MSYFENKNKTKYGYYSQAFGDWLNGNFNPSLFDRYEFKNDPDGNKGSWTKDELYEKWDKHEYNYYLSKSGNQVLAINSNNPMFNIKKENYLLKEKMLLNNIADSLCDSFVTINLPENIKTLLRNDNVIVVPLPIFKYNGMTFSVDDFTIDEVYQILNHGDKFAIYLMKENLTIIRGRAIYTGMNLKQNNNNNNKLKKESIMEELKAGDVVCFKSGSPNMTIEHITDTTIKEAECVWFVNDNLFKGIFAVDSLTMPETSKDSKEG